MISMKSLISTGLVLFSLVAMAEKSEKKAPAKTEAAVSRTQQQGDADDESLMTERLNLDVGEYIEIKRYDAETKTYQILVVDDPTPEAIYATPESVTTAIHSLNPRSMKADPTDIVGSRYNLDEELPILFDFEREQRRR